MRAAHGDTHDAIGCAPRFGIRKAAAAPIWISSRLRGSVAAMNRLAVAVVFAVAAPCAAQESRPARENAWVEATLKKKKLPAALKITYDDVHGLHGGLSLTIDGTGAVTQRAVRVKARPPKLKVAQPDLARLAKLLLTLEAWAQSEPEREAKPDESRARLRIELGKQRVVIWEWYNDLEKNRRIVRARELMKQIAWTKGGAVEYQAVDGVGALSELEGKSVLLVGRVTTLQWAHLGGFFPEHPNDNLFEVGDDRLVVYSKTPIEAKGDVEVRGTVHKLQGAKDSKAEGRAEYVVLADSWKAAD
jgi:hypothetical protein